MNMIQILVLQIGQMFLLAGIGYLLFKGGKITREGSRALGNILIYAALPAAIVKGFLMERTAERMQGMLLSAVGALILLLLSILIASFAFRGDPVAVFAASFSNPGFFGIPLIAASMGQGALFYVACYVAFLNIGQWTFGVSVLNGQPVRQGFQWKKLIRAPFIIAILTGLFLFLTEIRLPSMLRGCLDAAAGLNTPLAMFTVGIYLAQTDLPGMLRKRNLYLISAARLVLIPLVSVLLMALVPAAFHDMKLALLLVAACPVGSNVAVYAQLHNKDYPYAVETVVMSTLFSLLSIPAVVWVSTLLWK